MTRAGYRWQRFGENIAAGQGRPEQVVAGWLASPGHCANIMAAEFADMGVGLRHRPASEPVVYWTQLLGRRRDAGQCRRRAAQGRGAVPLSARAAPAAARRGSSRPAPIVIALSATLNDGK